MSRSGHVDRPDECTSLRILTKDGISRVDLGDFIVKDEFHEFEVLSEHTFNFIYEKLK